MKTMNTVKVGRHSQRPLLWHIPTTNMYVCAYAYMHAFRSEWPFISILCMRACMRVCVHVGMRVMCACMHASLYECLSVCCCQVFFIYDPYMPVRAPKLVAACYCPEQPKIYAVLYVFPMYATAKIYAVYVLAIYAKKNDIFQYTTIYCIYYRIVYSYILVCTTLWILQ